MCRYKATQKYHSLTPNFCDEHYDVVKTYVESTKAWIDKEDKKWIERGVEDPDEYYR